MRTRPEDGPQLDALTPLLRAFLPYWVQLVAETGRRDGDQDVERGVPHHGSEAGGQQGVDGNGVGTHSLDDSWRQTVYEPVGAVNLSDITTPSGFKTPKSRSSSISSLPSMPPALRMHMRSGLAGLHLPSNQFLRPGPSIRTPQGAGRGSARTVSIVSRPPPPPTSSGIMVGLFGRSCPGLDDDSI